MVRANGLRFHVAQAGNGEPLVLALHGFPECWYSWRNQLPILAQAGWRVWAPDMRGYNLSDKPRGVRAYAFDALTLDVIGLLDAAQVERAVIVGHDWGGYVAWRLAMDYSERVSKLVILNVPHPALARRALLNRRQWLRSWYISWFQVPFLPEALISMNPTLSAQILRRTAFNQNAFTDDDLKVYARALAQPGAMRSAVNYYRAMVRGGFWLPAKPIDAPTLFIWGTRDFALRQELTDGTERYVRNLRMHYIPNSGHWVQNEAPQEVNAALLNFLDSTERV